MECFCGENLQVLVGNPVQVQVLLSARQLREVHRNNKAGTIQVYLKMVSVLLFCIYGDSRGTSVSEKRLYALHLYALRKERPENIQLVLVFRVFALLKHTHATLIIFPSQKRCIPSYPFSPKCNVKALAYRKELFRHIDLPQKSCKTG